MTDETKISDELQNKRKAVMDKVTGKEIMQKFNEEQNAEMAEKKAKFMPPVITEPRCDVCTHPYRTYIEWCLTKGYRYQTISNTVPPNDDGKKPSRKSISNHYQEHMKIEETVIRHEIEEEAERLGHSVSDGVGRLLTERGILKTLIQKAYDDAQDGKIEIQTRDLIQMLKLYREIEDKSSNLKTEQVELYLDIFRRAAQNIFTAEQQKALSNEIRRLREEEEITQGVEGYIASKSVDAEAEATEIQGS